ncbi:MAG: carboxypeptidase regulatory-like domain-containing protein [Gemmatimonadetes bacterium]|nr:carboxypeptidase regulatory-like domain-containing protein [Gemmatimonadota bacterium]
MTKSMTTAPSTADQLTRREFLGVVSAAGVASIVGACGGGAKDMLGPVATGTISGQVLDLQGRPQPGLGSLILMYDSGRQVGVRATPDANGRFAFSAMPAGDYQIRFDAPGQAIIPDPYENPIRFTVAAGKDTFVPVRVQLGDYTQNLVEIYIGEGFFQQQPDGKENAEVVVKSGTNICWYNVDVKVHTVTGGPWGDSGDLVKTQAYFWTATTPGTYAYRCKYHQPQEQAVLRITP